MEASVPEYATVVMKRSMKYPVARYFDPREFVSFVSHHLKKKVFIDTFEMVPLWLILNSIKDVLEL